MSAPVLVAIAATMGDLLFGWDNATIAGAVLYIKKEFNLNDAPTMEGLIVAASIIGATLMTTCSGTLADHLGRRPTMIISSVCFFVSSLIMLWSPNVYVLVFGRLLDGCGCGLAVALGPLYISETAPTEIRGSLNTLPQFSGSTGMFVAYCMVFGMSLMETPRWRLMLGILCVPSVIYFLLTVFFLPESPRWLVSKGRMNEAKHVLQWLRNREDVSAEMALLVEGLGVGGDVSLEEYLIKPDAGLIEDQDELIVKDQIKLYGSEAGRSWVARPVTGQSTLGIASRQGSLRSPSIPLMDPLVTLFGSVHERPLEQGSMRSIIFPSFGSMFSIGGKEPKYEESEEENVIGDDDDDDDYAHEDEDYACGADEDDHLHSPLMSSQDKSIVASGSGNMFSMKPSSLIQLGEASGIGGGWQLAWNWSEGGRLDGSNKRVFKRLYLHQEGDPGSKRGSYTSLPGGGNVGENEYVKAAALVSHPALYSRDFLDQRAMGPAMVHPSEASLQGPSWRALLEPGVRRALVVGVGIQLLQQFSGINGVLYYIPQILKQAGVGELLSHFGIGASSSSLLISAFTTLLMLPAIAVAMRLMDISGRRTLLLTTIPVLFVSLAVLILTNLVKMNTSVYAVISTVTVVLYICFFVMGFGPIPNILCAEIFPTKIRGNCIAICALAFWIGDNIVTYTLPIMLNAVGLAGLFGFYAVVSFIAWIFIFLKVPETKGMPLEVITEFFALGSTQVTEDDN